MSMTFFRELETCRLKLINISLEDREFIYQLFSDDTVNRYLFDAEPVIDISEADEIIKFYLQPEPREQHRWVLNRKADGVKLGTCGFHCWDKARRCCDIGYDLLPEHWGNGYMNEAIQAILEFAKTEMEIRHIQACIYPDNQASIRLANKHGFLFSGIMKDEIFRGKAYPHKVLTLDYLKM